MGHEAQWCRLLTVVVAAALVRGRGPGVSGSLGDVRSLLLAPGGTWAWSGAREISAPGDISRTQGSPDLMAGFHPSGVAG